jgi:Sterol desaturase
MCSSTPPLAAAQEPAPNTSGAIPPPPLHRTDDEDDAKKNGDISQNKNNIDNNKEQQDADNKHHQAKDNPRIAVCPVLSSATTKITNTTNTLDLGISVKQILFHDISSAKDNQQQRQQQDTVYSWQEPPQQEKLHFHEHFSSLLLRGSVQNTLLEFALLLLPFVFLAIFDWDYNQGHDDNNKNATIMMTLINVEGSMPMRQVAIGLVVCCIIRRIYNTYLEAIYFTFPSLRTQPPKEHRLSGHPRNKKDLMGRDRVQLEILESHDKWTLVSQFVLNFALYYALPGFYPAATTAATGDTSSVDSHSPVLQISFLQLLLTRFLRLVLNHYVLSFGMYWAHRSLHVIPWLWDNIHSLHHYARHPLSRNTYEDHWLDNLLNSILGHVYAQILVPLDGPTFWFSRIFRILESLEKHSGVSCGFNIAHSVQQWLPFAQMPHHHDWHHEGYKGSNYTFSSLGGLWDCIFGTRKGGRFKANHYAAATREDMRSASAGVGRAGFGNSIKKGERGGGAGGFFFLKNPLWPLVGLTVLVGMKLRANGCY